MTTLDRQYDLEVGFMRPDGQAGDPFLPQRVALESRYTHDFVYLVGGYRFGKTAAGGHWAHLGLTENEGATGLIVAATYTDLGAYVLPALQEIWEQYRRHTGVDVAAINPGKGVVETIWGSRALLRSFDRPRFLVGFEAAWAWVDEGELPVDPEFVLGMVTARMSQVSRAGSRTIRWTSVLVTSTMGDRATSILKHFKSRITAGDRDYRIVRAPTSMNPYLPAKYTERLARQMTRRMYRRLVEADLTVLEQQGARFGQVFHPGYHDPDAGPASGNKIRWEFRARLDWMVFIDWGLRPHALFCQHDVEGIYTGVPDSLVVFYEVYGERWSDEHFISEVAAEIVRLRIGLPSDMICDPHGSTAAVGIPKLRRAFPLDRARRRPLIHATAAPDDRREIRDNLIELLLCRGDGRRRLFFADTLDWTAEYDKTSGKRGVVWAVMRGYRWKQGQDGEPLLVTKKDGLSDHPVEALGYGLEWRFPREAEFIAQHVGGRYHRQLYGREFNDTRPGRPGRAWRARGAA